MLKELTSQESEAHKKLNSTHFAWFTRWPNCK